MGFDEHEKFCKTLKRALRYLCVQCVLHDTLILTPVSIYTGVFLEQEAKMKIFNPKIKPHLGGWRSYELINTQKSLRPTFFRIHFHPLRGFVLR